MKPRLLGNMWKGIVKFVSTWMGADGFGLAAAISFYAIFSLAPILAAGMYFSAKFVGEEKAREGVVVWLSEFLNADQAEVIISAVAKSNFAEGHGISIIVAFGIFVWASSLVFVRLQMGVNRLLGVEEGCIVTAVKSGLFGRLKAMGASLLVVTAIVIGVLGVVVFGASFLVLIGGISFVMIRLLSSRRLSWKAQGTAVLVIMITFEIGRYFLTWYFKTSEVASAYGAASTLVVVLLWIYYNAQVFLLGVTIGGLIQGRCEDLTNK